MQQLPVHDAGASCDLDEQGAARRTIEFADVVRRGLRDRERTQDRVRLTFEREPGLEEDLRGLIRRESECCAFFSFDIDAAGDVITVEVTAPSEKEAYVDALYRGTDPQDDHVRGSAQECR